MSDWLGLLTNVLILITAGLSLFASIRNRKEIDKTKSAVHEIHVAINSRMDELLRLTATASRAEGVKEQAERES